MDWLKTCFGEMKAEELFGLFTESKRVFRCVAMLRTLSVKIFPSQCALKLNLDSYSGANL
jgi:hypothetical protein